VFNHSQFIPGLVNQVNSFGLTDSLTTAFVRIGDGTKFNQPTLAFPNNARTMQLTAKFIF
jgi:hypothetical protein